MAAFQVSATCHKLCAAISLLVFGCSSELVGSGLAPGEVLQWRSDVARSGYVNVSAPDKVKLAWRVDGINKGTHSAAKASPLMVGSDLLVPADTGILYRFAVNQTVRWAAAQKWFSEFGFHSTPCVIGDLVVIGAYDGRLYGYSYLSGNLVWEVKLGDAIGSSPACTADTAYISVQFRRPVAGSLCAVDIADGTQKWCTHNMRNQSHSSVALDLNLGVAVVGCNDALLYAYNVATGDPQGTFKTGGEIKGPVLLWRGLAVFGSWDKVIYGVDALTLEERWRVPMGGRGMSGAAVDPDTDVIYIGSHDGYLRAIRFDGGILWRYKAKSGFMSSPVVTRNLVLFGDDSSVVYGVKKESGKLAWSFKHGRTGKVTSSLAVSQHHVAFTSRSYQNECKSPKCLVKPGAIFVLKRSLDTSLPGRSSEL